jgi:hypothetical protein
MEREIGYKVVRVVPIDHTDLEKGVKLISYTKFNLIAYPDFKGLEYGIGIETRRREGDGPLACLDTKRHVKKFFANEGLSPRFERSNFRVYKCEFIRDNESDRSLWIQIRPNERSSFPLGACPDGTILCDMIELTEEVEM